MSHITKVAAVETSTAIWEFDPTLPSNSMLNGNLDIIASICTIAVKIQASPQRVEYFESFSFSSVSNPHSKSLCTAMSAGDPHLTCLTVPINYER